MLSDLQITEAALARACLIHTGSYEELRKDLPEGATAEDVATFFDTLVRMCDLLHEEY